MSHFHQVMPSQLQMVHTAERGHQRYNMTLSYWQVIYLIQVRLRTEELCTWALWGSNSLPQDYNSTFHVTDQPERRLEEKRVEPGKIIIAFKLERRCEMRK